MIKNFLPKLALLTFSTLFGLIVIVIVIGSRIVLPISAGAQRLDMQGQPVVTTENGSLTYIPGLVYRQVSAEFDAVVTISEFGQRIPSPQGNPEIVFIGDSFTFGTGLRDEETFAYIFCTERQISCANLGRINTGTHELIS